MDEVEATRVVERYAEEALQLSGWAGFSEARLAPGPCVGRRGETSDTMYSMQGSYQLLVPAERHAPLLDRVRTGWRERGYTITAHRTIGPDQGGAVRATNPTDGTMLTLTSGELPAMLLLIHSACYERR